MAIRPIVLAGDPVLRQKAKKVRTIDESIQTLIDDMIETMRDERGVGLAAPQVHESLRLFVMDPGAGEENAEPRVVVNPVLSFPTEDTIQLWEGCLSIPGIRGETERFADVDVSAWDRHGKAWTESFHDFAAAVVQHETDHLDGLFFLARMPDANRIAFEDEFARYIRDEGESPPE